MNKIIHEAERRIGKPPPIPPEEYRRRLKKIHGSNLDFSCAEFNRAQDHVLVICRKSKDHGTFKATPNNLLRGRGCRKCGILRRNEKQKKYSIEDLKKVATNLGFKCLSNEYLGYNKHHLFQCKNGHPPWSTIAMLILYKKSGCPYCSGHAGVDHLDEMKEIVKSRGGRLISKKFLGTDVKHEITCQAGHCFLITWNNLKLGRWCKDCSGGFSEEVCRQIFEHLFKKPFRKIRPCWLIGPKGKPLELDGANMSLKLAFEYQGRHTYFKRRAHYDLMKKRLCRRHGIKLIEVPHTEVPWGASAQDVFMNVIVKKLKKSNTKFSLNRITTFQLNLRTTRSLRKFNQLSELAKKKGGKFLEQSYLGYFQKHRFVCGLGHEFLGTPNNMLKEKGYWCDRCADLRHSELRRIGSLGEAQQFAKERGGNLLSTEYRGHSYSLKWECKYGHEFINSMRYLKLGAEKGLDWCPDCRKLIRQTLKKS